MKKILAFIKRETVLTVAWVLAILSTFFTPPDAAYIGYIDFRSLGILWGLMVIMQGLRKNGLFERIGLILLTKTQKVWQLCAVLIFLCFFGGMLITNDVALITFVPFAVLMLAQAKQEQLMIPTVVLQTIAANLGSMLTPIGNPQNLYLYGLSGMSLGEFVLWMLPYTVLSGILLVLSLLLLPGKTVRVYANVEAKAGASDKGTKYRIALYLVLFAVALLAVARVLDYRWLLAIVFVTVLVTENKVLVQVDYALLLTFVGFFIFTGNMGRIPVVEQALAALVEGREIGVGVAVSQCISNVPAALLLSEFTGDYKALLLGVNIGGLGTLIASMASLISYKIFVNEYSGKKGRYFAWFTAANVVYLVILMTAAVCFTGRFCVH